MPHALIVDNDPLSRSALAQIIARDGYTTALAGSLAEARTRFDPMPDLVLVDLVLPDGSGMELLSDPTIARRSDIVLITGDGSVESSVSAMRLGAFDYLTKPLDAHKLQGVLTRVSQPGAQPARASFGTAMPTAAFTVTIGESLAEVERRLILHTVQRCRTREEAARILKISTKTLYNKLRAYEAGARWRGRETPPPGRLPATPAAPPPASSPWSGHDGDASMQ